VRASRRSASSSDAERRQGEARGGARHVAWQKHAHRRALALARLDLEAAAVLLDDRAHRGEAEARAGRRLGGEEGLEQVRQHLRRHAGAVVHDRDRDLVLPRAGAGLDLDG
jgi:hypothetical protein